MFSFYYGIITKFDKDNGERFYEYEFTIHAMIDLDAIEKAVEILKNRYLIDKEKVDEPILDYNLKLFIVDKKKNSEDSIACKILDIIY